MAKKKSKKTKERKVSEEKKAIFAKLLELAKANPTIMIISIEGIPSINFQQIKKALKAETTIVVVKKKMALRVLEQLKKEKPALEALEKWLEKPSCALLFSKLDVFELAGALSSYSFPAKIKAGQLSPQEIALEPGITEMPAGPLLSKLSALGIKVGIEGGKIAIKERKILVKKDEKISDEAASILTALEITPFNIAPVPLAAYDSKKNVVYEEIKIDKEATTKELKEVALESLALSIYLAYPVSENIQLLLRKAAQELHVLSGLIK